MNRLDRIRTLAALGPRNLARVGFYRLGLRSGFHPVQRIAAGVPQGPFLRAPPRRSGLPQPNRAWDGKLRWFDWKEVPNDGSPPDWFTHPFEGDSHLPGADRPWWQIPDFGTGDIKNVWELSRFGWAVAFATEAAAGDEAALGRLNEWLQSWAEANPPYRGPNWKCGQEASIRVLHLLLAATLLDQDRDPLPGLVRLVEVHLKRIAPTLSYAIGQQNNHATSEAAALFLGGDLLARAGDRKGEGWSRQGRRLLDNRATNLIEPDGSFSQHSVVYHRLMLDTYCLAEAWRRRHELAPFSSACLDRLRAATNWLDHMVDRTSGDAPNLGANDGARLMPLTEGYRDFRPSLQLASILFRESRAIGAEGRWNDPLRWLEIPLPAAVAPAPASRTFDDGGYHVLRAGDTLGVLRYPRFRFRPSQADALHFDLWAGGRNLLRDAGTFSYADPDGAFFSGTSAHNTVQFDSRDQMVRLGRFLFGGWLRASGVAPVTAVSRGIEARAGYIDPRGPVHQRHVRLEEFGLRCTDRIGGTFGHAVLRWRLPFERVTLEQNQILGADFKLEIHVEGAEAAIRLVGGTESRYYEQQSEVVTVEVRVEHSCTITTRIHFPPSARKG